MASKTRTRERIQKAALEQERTCYFYKPRHARQQEVCKLWKDNKAIVAYGPAGTGKAQPLTAKVITPCGQKPMGDIRVGELVCTPSGVSTVVGVFPQGEKEVFKITFSDGSSTECCEDHLWTVGDNSNGWKSKTVDTRYLKKNYFRRNRRCLYLPGYNPVEFGEKQHLIDPYLLGVLLADGGITDSIKITTVDLQIIEEIKNLISNGYKLAACGGSAIDYRLSKIKNETTGPSIYIDELRRLGLFGCKSESKFIPNQYLTGSIHQRTRLLQGIMDGDGTVDKRTGMPIFYTSSLALLTSFKWLVASLGGTCSVSVKNGRYFSKKLDRCVECLTCYVVHVCLPNEIIPFNLERKLALLKKRTKYFPKRYVSSIVSVGTKQVQCIKIESKDGLYLTDEFIVTHNTSVGIGLAIQDLLAGEIEHIILCRPVAAIDEELGYNKGSYDEKIAPWMASFKDALRGFSHVKLADLGTKVEYVSVGMIGGRTIQNAVMVVDEAQNLTRNQVLATLTRVGDNGKVFYCGDFEQAVTGRRKNNALELMTRTLKQARCDEFAAVEFLEEDQLRSPFVQRVSKILRESKF